MSEVHLNIQDKINNKLTDEFLNDNSIRSILLFIDWKDKQEPGQLMLRTLDPPTTADGLQSRLTQLMTEIVGNVTRLFKRVFKVDFVLPKDISYDNAALSADYIRLLHIVELVGRDKLEALARQAYEELKIPEISKLETLADNLGETND